MRRLRPSPIRPRGFGPGVKRVPPTCAVIACDAEGSAAPASPAAAAVRNSRREFVDMVGLRELPDFDVFPQDPWTWLPSEHAAVAIHRHELGSAARFRIRVTTLIENEVLHPAGFGVPDSDPLFPTWIVHAVRLRVGHVDLVLIVEGDPARRPELHPRRQMLSFLIEELDPVVS